MIKNVIGTIPNPFNSSRITNGPIEELVEDTSSLRFLGLAKLRQSSWSSAIIIIQYESEKLRFVMPRHLVMGLTMEQFKQVVNEFLVKTNSYLAETSAKRDMWRRYACALPYYKLEGKLYLALDSSTHSPYKIVYHI